MIHFFLWSDVEWTSDDYICDMSQRKSADSMIELEQEYTKIVKQVFSELPNYEQVVPALVEFGILNLSHHCHLTPGELCCVCCVLFDNVLGC